MLVQFPSRSLPLRVQNLIDQVRAGAFFWRFDNGLEITHINLRTHYPQIQDIQSEEIFPFISLDYQERCKKLMIEDKQFELAMTGLIISHLDKIMEQIPTPSKIIRDTTGKPRLIEDLSHPDSPHHESKHAKNEPAQMKRAISWSRSAPWLTIGLAGSDNRASNDLGIDVERRRPLDFQAIIATICADKEQAAFQAIAQSAQSKRFFAIWTLKEAILKARGSGFQANAKEIIIPDTAFSATPENSVDLACFGHTFKVGLIEHQETTIAIARLFK